jgi:hypothetical protein
MRTRSWKVEWRAQGTSDGLERLSQAVKLMIDRALVEGEPEHGNRVVVCLMDDHDSAHEEAAR